jgi:D-inositol-3-phosphate glycosyltransferase
MKTKIAFISEHASPLAMLGGVDNGGQNVYVGELAKHLVLLGYEVDIFTRWDNPNLPPVVSWVPNVRVIHVPAGPIEVMEKEKLLPYMPAFTDFILSFIESEAIEYDLIHANFWMSAMAAAEIKKRLHIPFVVTFHALGAVRKLHQKENDKFPPERINIEKQIVQEADCIIAECPQDKEDLLRFYEAPQERICIIPCGFSPHEFYPLDRLLARMVLNIDHNDPILLQLGRMVPRKGVDTVLRALGRARQKGCSARLLVVGGETEELNPGDNPEITRLQQIVEQEKITDAVTFVGRKNRDVLKYYYAAADIFITTPWYEPFGITPLEAMACGTPVIGSAVGGIKYSVEDGETGFLVPPNDPDALAAKITALLDNNDLMTTMKNNSIKRVNALFTWSIVAKKISALYDRVLLEYTDNTKESEALIFIKDSFNHASDIFCKTREVLQVPILEAAQLLTKCFVTQKKVLVCGNGGSAAESQHLVAELVGRFEMSKRRGLPAISLTSDSTILTAWSNDIHYEDAFARQVEAYGQPGDVLFCFSTSGQSINVIKAMKMALQKEMFCIALTGKGGGDMSAYAHVNIVVPSDHTQRIQEMHLHILHTLCSLIEHNMFAKKNRKLQLKAKDVDLNAVKAINDPNQLILNRVA